MSENNNKKKPEQTKKPQQDSLQFLISYWTFFGHDPVLWLDHEGPCFIDIH